MSDHNLGEYHPPEDIPETAEETEKVVEKSEIIPAISSADAKHLIHCLTIIGQVEGHFELSAQNKTTKYEHIIPALVAIEQDRSIEGLLIILNTVGGDVEAGFSDCRIDFGNADPDSFPCGGGRSFHWCAVGGECEAVIYCAVCIDDDSPRPHEWNDVRRSTKSELYRPHSGQNH